MKQIFLLIFIIVTIFSCDFSSNDTPLLVPPIIVVAKHSPTKNSWGSIVLKDARGEYWSGNAATSNYVEAIVDSYNVGDTIK